MDPIHILHLSDLHLSSPIKWDQDVLLQALQQDLGNIRFTHAKPDLVVFSGDLAGAGGAKDAYEPVLEFLLKTLDTLGLDERRLITCAGNHDVDQAAVGPKLPKLVKYRDVAKTRHGANELADSSDFRAYVHDAFACYQILADEFAADSRIYSDSFSATHFLRDLGIAVVSLNTATLSAAGLTDQSDQNSLCIPEKTIVTALDRVPAGIPTMVVAHHPLFWLNEENATMVEKIIASRGIALLNGHLHEAIPRQIRVLGDQVLHAQSGALYCGRGYWNGYALLSIAPDQSYSRIALRRWFEPRREFSKAEDIGDDGMFFSSKESASYWRAITPPFDLVALERWRSTTLLPVVEGECNASLSGTALDALFVRPEFEKDVPYRREADGRVGSRTERSTFKELIESPTNFVIAARPETGKSTLLKQMALSLARMPATTPTWTIPVILSFGALRAYPAYIEGQIRQRIPELPRDVTVQSLLDRGLLTIMVDDVDFAAAEKQKGLAQFVSKHPKCRYIFTSSTTFVETAALQPEIVPDVPFTKVRMGQFMRGQLLALVENHGVSDPLKIDQMVERVMRDVSALNVPLTAVTGTFLIQIIREEPDSNVINQAALIERFIEMLLQKYAPRELLPGAFDFKNKLDLLCNIAEIMARQDEYDPDENDVVGWCIDYLHAYGLNYSARDLVSYFLEARLLERSGTKLRFRLRMFFEFFAAMRMIDSPGFKEYVFADERYLKFVNEIGFYSALHRRDKDQLERIMGEFNKLTQAIWGENAQEHHAYLENLKTPNATTTEEELAELRQQIASPEQILADRKDLLEGADYIDDEKSQLVSRPDFLTDHEKWVGHLLLLSAMVKHMELIPDVDKRRLLSETLDGWVKFTALSLGVVTELAKNRRVVFNGVTYKSALSDNVPVGEMARRLSLSMPSAVARMATIFLGTDKLRLQLGED